MTIEELRIFNEESERIERKLGYHTRQGLNYKRLYESTKNRKGFYKVLNKIALDRNRYHCEKGSVLAISRLKETEKVFQELGLTKEELKEYANELIDKAY